jgi:nucleotide-binding universal stress UspA family protein
VPDGPILICFDGTPGAENAVLEAATLLAHADAVVLAVEPVPMVAETYAPLGPTIGELERLGAEKAASRAHAGAAIAQRAGFAVQARGDVASPAWTDVVEVADEIDASAIVVPAGKLARRVLEHAARPVLIVPEQRGDGAHD